MLPQSLRQLAMAKGALFVGGLLLSGGAVALASTTIQWLLEGEPGPAGSGVDPTDYYTKEQVDALVPSPAPWISRELAESFYAKKGDLPDLSGKASKSALQELSAQWATRHELADGYWSKAELPDYTGFWSYADAANYAFKADIPKQDQLVFDAPDVSQWVTWDDFTDNYVQWEEVESIPTKAEVQQTYLSQAGQVMPQHSDQLKLLIANELNHPTCAHDEVEVGLACVDKYEASLWAVPCDAISGIDLPLGVPGGSALPANFAANGTGPSVYACSLPQVQPARGITWFQAARACSASGKRLCSNEEWQAAALGTPTADCKVSGGLSVTGAETGCVSAAGAIDMVGNAAEFTSEWVMAGAVWPTAVFGSTPSATWPIGFGSDFSVGIVGVPLNSGPLPAVVARGGSAIEGTAQPGPFAADVVWSAATASAAAGFRCCVAR